MGTAIGGKVPDARAQEIASEQGFVDRVYARVETARAESKALASEGHGRAAAGPASGLMERDAMVHLAAGQLRALDAEEEGLVFGRLDYDDGEAYHIGRLGLRDERHEPLPRHALRSRTTRHTGLRRSSGPAVG
jgi:DNA helicase IV